MDGRGSPHEEIFKLFDLLPNRISRILTDVDYDLVQELVLDLGRDIEIRYPDTYVPVVGSSLTGADLTEVLDKLRAFGPDDRTGVDGTLHRISRINNRVGECVGLTFRAGRDFPSSTELIDDLLLQPNSMLLLGPPSSGKTTTLRSIARFLSSGLHKRVVVIDTSNEIGGEGDVPHSAIGRARRMQVPGGQLQADIMIRAVENHNPNVLIIDEISTEAEVQAARTIAQRGIQLIATAHGCHLEDLILNPPLSLLVGGVDKVTISDDAMERRGLKNKTKLEREMEPTFDVVIELLSFSTVAVHKDVRQAVDCLLSEGTAQPEERRILIDPQGKQRRKMVVTTEARYVLGQQVKVPEIVADKPVRTTPVRPVITESNHLPAPKHRSTRRGTRRANGQHKTH